MKSFTAFFRRAPSAKVAQAAAALIAAFGPAAYEEARTRAREARLGAAPDEARAGRHWDRVRAEIARRTGRKPATDTATRYLEG